MPRIKRKQALGDETPPAAGPRKELSMDSDSALLGHPTIDLEEPLHKKIKANGMEATDAIESVKTDTAKDDVSSLPIPTLKKEDPNDISDDNVVVDQNILLKELLDHRKMLLIRIRQVQAASKRRLDTLTGEAISGDDEIIKYSENISKINSLIRKQQAQEPQEKRNVGRRASSIRVNQPKNNNEVNVLENLVPHISQRPSKRPVPGQAPKNRPRRTQARVVCPETIALRDQRDELRRKLLDLAQKRQPQDNAVQVTERRRSSMSIASSKQVMTYKAEQSLQKPIFTCPEPPPDLPSRRKTHWDTLLQEMKWLATDFREERKWKYATAKLLGKELLAKDADIPSTEAPDANLCKEDNKEDDVDKQDDGGIPVSTVGVFTSDEETMLARGVASQTSNYIANAVSNMRDENGVSKSSKKRKRDDTKQQVDPEASIGISLQSCSTMIDKAMKALEKGAVTGRRSRSESYGRKLTEAQEHLVLAVEDRWQRVKSGVYVRGHLASGKTVCACSLLWRNRDNGPQIVVCSPGSMLRWAHEIKRFSGLKALCAATADTIDHLVSGDVLLCSYSGLPGIVMNKPVSFQFHGMVLDIRHPNGFRGSGMCEGLNFQQETPQELFQSSWWTLLANLSKPCKRIIVGRLDTSLSFLENGSNRQKLSILGLQLCLLIGVSHFHQGCGSSLEKCILRWGRFETKSNSTKDSKFRKVLSLFSDIREKCCMNLKDGNRRHNSDEDVWDVRLCEMPVLHLEGYQKSCREVIAVLSRGTVSPPIIANSLLVLRKMCFCTKQWVGEKPPHAMKLSASQPNVDAANELLLHSGKLQELTSILVHEFGMVIPSSTLKMLPIGDKKKIRTKVKNQSDVIRRIAILAVSTEVQLLVSALLCHLGLWHYLLIDSRNSQSDLTWMHFQQSLRSFNEHDGDHSAVLIASPHVIAGDHLGLGIERADAVICVEDDWSGRGELIMQSLTQRNRYCRDAEGLSICRFINLTTKDSVEESLLKTVALDAIGGDLETKWPPVHSFVKPGGIIGTNGSSGALSIAISDTNANALWERSPFSSSLSSFPARNVFHAASINLDDFLSFGGKGSVRLVGDKQKSTLFSAEDMHCFSAFVGELVVGEDRLSGNAPSFISLDTTDFPRSAYSNRGTPNWNFSDFNNRLRVYLQQPCLREPGFDQNQQLYRPKAQTFRERGGRNRDVGQGFSASGDYDAKSDWPLFYQPNDAATDSNRSNLFSKVFSLRRSLPDELGEPMVYFPPLFPLVKDCSVIARLNVEAMQRHRFSSGDKHVENLSDKAEHRIVTEEEATRGDAASVLIDLFDDYGLVGLGAIPLPRDSALAAAVVSVPTTDPTASTRDFIDPVDFEGRKTLVVLTSKKRKRGTTPFQRSSMDWNIGIGNLNPTTGLDVSLQSGSTSVDHPAKEHSPLDSHRWRLLSSLRRFGMGSSMFEAPIFRVASVRVRNKVAGRLLRLGWSPGAAYEAGPGLPLVVEKDQPVSRNLHQGFFEFDHNLWTSVVKRIQNKTVETGAEAVDLSNGQRASFRRSLVAPCRVDFGPFQCGFLSATGGMSLGAPPRNRVGVALPMGVKISFSLTKEHITLSWSADDDRLLHAAAERFCLNWVVAAAELGGSQDIAVVSHSESPRFRATRAARSCRDRWQRLVRNSPSMLVEVRKSERFTLKPLEPPTKGALLAGNPSHLLVHSIEPSMNVPSAPNPRKRRTFHAVRTSQARTQQAPLQIPGISPGSNHATVVPTHPSHEQHNCKPDLCPLHILDANLQTATGHTDLPTNRR